MIHQIRRLKIIISQKQQAHLTEYEQIIFLQFTNICVYKMYK